MHVDTNVVKRVSEAEVPTEFLVVDSDWLVRFNASVVTLVLFAYGADHMIEAVGSVIWEEARAVELAHGVSCGKLDPLRLEGGSVDRPIWIVVVGLPYRGALKVLLA